jgi:hypothetical protein
MLGWRYPALVDALSDARDTYVHLFFFFFFLCGLSVLNPSSLPIGPIPDVALHDRRLSRTAIQPVRHARHLWVGMSPDDGTHRLYEHISSMWYHEGRLPEESVAFAWTEYAAYAVKRPDGLRILSLDSDMCE